MTDGSYVRPERRLVAVVLDIVEDEFVELSPG
jgi:hypothetical protein